MVTNPFPDFKDYAALRKLATSVVQAENDPEKKPTTYILDKEAYPVTRFTTPETLIQESLNRAIASGADATQFNAQADERMEDAKTQREAFLNCLDSARAVASRTWVAATVSKGRVAARES
jgi:hypothetical protein